MSYDRATATFHLEFLEGGSLSSSGGDATAANINVMGGGGCLVTCEVPGVEVADDVDAVPDDEDINIANNQHNIAGSTSSSGLAAAFRSSPLLSRAILYSDALQSAVSELYDVPGANIVQVSLSNKGIELGTVGPRSECWVNVPYHRGQGGMYVGLECYKPNVPLFGIYATSSSSDGNNNIVRRYSLSAFLSGMRGLDIGLETCISVNARGMMAIQHQVERRDGYYNYSEDGGGANAKPSFVDFIMTCIEEDIDEEAGHGGLASQEDASVRMEQQQFHNNSNNNNNGLNDITNTDSADLEEVAISSRRKNREGTNARSKSRKGKGSSSEEEEEEEERRPSRKAGQTGKQNANAESDEEAEFGGNDEDIDFGEEDAGPPKRPSNKESATSRLLGELEMDSDMLSSRRGGAAKATLSASQGRKNALEDLRRRRQEQQKQRQSLEYRNQNKVRKSAEQSEEEDDDDASDTGKNGRQSNDSNNSRKRRSNSSKVGATSRKTRRSYEEEEEEGNHNNEKNGHTRRHHSNPAQDSQQSQSEDDDDDGDETENELDVTADIPLPFSKKRSSLSTSRHSAASSRFRASSSMNDGSEDETQEPRMMYGDTKLEFTQDSYDSE